VTLPAVPRRRARFIVHPAAAAAAMAVAAFTIGGLVNLSPSPYHQAAVDLRSVRQVISVKERQMDASTGAPEKARTSGLDSGVGTRDPSSKTKSSSQRASSSSSGFRAQAAWR